MERVRLLLQVTDGARDGGLLDPDDVGVDVGGVGVVRVP